MKAAVSLMLLLILCVPAESHPSREVKRVEAHVFGDRMVIFLRYEVSEPRYSADLRERFDIDGDRRLSRDERQSLAAYAQEEAIRDLRVVLDGRDLRPAATLKASTGLDRPLPSAHPVVLYWQFDFVYPEDSLQPGRVHVIGLDDSESRWNSGFHWSLRLAPGLQYADTPDKAGSDAAPRSLEFPKGGGSFRIPVLFQNPMRYQNLR